MAQRKKPRPQELSPRSNENVVAKETRQNNYKVVLYDNRPYGGSKRAVGYLNTNDPTTFSGKTVSGGFTGGSFNSETFGVSRTQSKFMQVSLHMYARNLTNSITVEVEQSYDFGDNVPMEDAPPIRGQVGQDSMTFVDLNSTFTAQLTTTNTPADIEKAYPVLWNVVEYYDGTTWDTAAVPWIYAKSPTMNFSINQVGGPTTTHDFTYSLFFSMNAANFDWSKEF